MKKLVRKILPGTTVRLAEEAYRRSRSKTLDLAFGRPAKGLRVIGVTGTNGKTTTCCFINTILKAAGYKTALLTTAIVEINGVQHPNTSHRTVPLAIDLLKMLKKAKKAGVDFVILEVTSQALHQHKLDPIPFEVAVMTNLTQEHLDYHKNMENYAEAKARLFNEYFRPKFSILNKDDEWFDYFYRESVGQVLSYGKADGSDLHLIAKELATNGSQFDVEIRGVKYSASINLPGGFNIFNALAAIGAAMSVGIKTEQALSSVKELQNVPGRMESINEGQSFSVIVDYAVTPDALKNALIALKKIARGRVMVVFGATGDRDKTKRPVMGEVAASHADRIYLTDDETYSEDPETIRREVYEGIKTAKAEQKTEVFDDREHAIESAFKEAQKGDIVLLAGLGHQDYRAMGGKKMPWDERKVAREILRKISQ